MDPFETDFDDLETYALRRDEQAFARVVRRYADFVYASCLRQVKEPSLADDAAQAVFVLLAQRAGKLNRGTRLVGWLFKVAGYASKNVIRSERRRKRYEKEAAVRATAVMPDQAVQRELEEIVDGAIRKLREADRDALLMRFFQGCSHEEIGETMGMTGHAAKMRVRRAVDKLREQLARDGIAVMPAVLEAGLAGLAGKSAPIGFAAAASKAALVGGGAIALATERAMTMATIKAAAMIIGAMLAMTGVATGVWYAARTESGGNAVAASPVTPSAKPAWREKFDAVYQLEKGEAVKWIRPPFIAERTDYYRNVYPDQAKADPKPPLRWFLYWAGDAIDTKRFIYGTGGRLQVRQVLGWLTSLRPEQYVAPKSLLNRNVEGDWMVRIDATVEEKLAGLQAVMAGRGVKFQYEQKPLDRDVMVAKGTFLPEEWDKEDVKLFVGEKGAAKGDVSNGGASFLFETLGTVLGKPVIGEWRGIGNHNIDISIEKGLNLAAMPKEAANAKIAKILMNLKEQAGLDFTQETRAVDTWVLSEGDVTAQPQPGWRNDFDQVYVLAPGEDIRRIMPPFTEGRQGFIDDFVHPDPAKNNGAIGAGSDPSGSGALIMEFNPATGRVDRWRRVSSTPWAPANLLSHLTGIPMASFVVTRGMGAPLPGDWISRKGATAEQRLEGYRKAMEETPQAFTWEKKKLTRDIIVAHGTFAPDEWPNRKVVVSVDPSGKGEVNQGGDVGYFLRHLATMTGRPVLNEWKGSDLLRVEFNQPSLELTGLSKEAKDEKLTPILQHLADQLHIELTLQTQEVESYVVSPVKQK